MERSNNPPTEELELFYLKQKLMIELLRDVATCKSNLTDSIKVKLAKILADVDLKYYVSLHNVNDNDHRTSNVFGLSPIIIEDLTFNEQKSLQAALENRILEKYPKLLETYHEMACGAADYQSDNTKTKESNDHQRLLGLSNSYISKLKESTELHMEMCNVMKEWIDARLGDVVQKAEDSVQLFEIKNKTLELKARIIEAQLSLHIYSQNNSVTAYMEVNKDISNKIDRLREEVTTYRRIIEDDF